MNKIQRFKGLFIIALIGIFAGSAIFMLATKKKNVPLVKQVRQLEQTLMEAEQANAIALAVATKYC